MVEDILNTRLMVKKSMKDYKKDKVKYIVRPACKYYHL